jgi:hypothetical protein
MGAIIPAIPVVVTVTMSTPVPFGVADNDVVDKRATKLAQQSLH